MKPCRISPLLMAGVMVGVLAGVLAGCAPLTPMPPLALPQPAAYKGSQPLAPALQHDDWWAHYQDPELDRLQQQLLHDSPDLGSAWARYQQARAATDALRADRLPGVGASAQLSRSREPASAPERENPSGGYANSAALGLSLDYELDLWGRIGLQVGAGIANEQAAQADLAGARLDLQARLADSVLALRGADQEIALLRQTETALAQASRMAGERHRAGLTSGLDVAQAEAQRASAASQLQQVLAQRDLLEHAIAALVGAHASSFSIAPAAVAEHLPQIPAGLPSELLQRRPDIAAAQRRVEAANARVGVARTAFFPSLRLSATGGYQGSDLGKLMAAPHLLWALGPGLLVNLFDGGRREAEVVRAQALLEESAQTYRATTLAAFQQVEDQLALLERYGQAAAAERLAVKASQRALALASHRYRDGAASYLHVVTAQTSALQAQRNALELNTRQRRASVQLARALGGGWSHEAPVARVARVALQTATPAPP